MIDFNVFQNSRFIEQTRQASYGVLAAITWNSKTIRSRTFWTDGRRLLVDLLRPPDWRVTCQTRPWTTSMSVPRSRTFGRFRTHRRRLVRVGRTWTLSSYWPIGNQNCFNWLTGYILSPNESSGNWLHWPSHQVNTHQLANLLIKEFHFILQVLQMYWEKDNHYSN